MAKILVVDDQVANRDLVVTLLVHRGHQALEAADGAEALVLARSERPVLVISDILMPTMDGFEFVRQLRADPALAGTEVIFYTAHYREREARNLAKSCGVSRVLAKPCEPQDILLAIDQALAHMPAPVPVADAQEFERDHLRLMTDKLSEKLADLEATNRRLAALTELNLLLASERDSQILLDKVCRGARDLLGAKYAVLGVAGKHNVEAAFFTSGIDAALLSTLDRPHMDLGPLGQVQVERRARRVRNPAGDAAALGLPSGYPPVQAGLVAPVVSLSRVYGWICLADKLGAVAFNEEDEQILTILAAQVGRIFENGSLYVEVQRHVALLQLEVDERKRSAQALRQSELRFRQLADNIREAFYLVAVEASQLLYVSPGYEDIWGRSCASLYDNPRSWLDAVHPDDQARVIQGLKAGYRKGASFELEYRIVRPDASLRSIRARSFAIRGEAGEILRYAGLAEDVTEQVRLQEALREREAGLHRAQLLARLTHVITGFDGGFESWPDSLSRLVGLESAVMIKSTREWLALVHPDDRALFRTTAIEAGVRHERREFEYRLRRSDGVWLHLRQVMEPLQAIPRTDARVRWFNTIQDISLQKQAEQELRESERRFSDMLGNVEMLSLMLDRESRITYCNDYLLRLTGWRREEIVGRDWFECFIPAGNGEPKDTFNALINDLPFTGHHENEILTRSGALRLVRWSNTVLRSVAGDVTGTASLGEDVTDRVASERKIRKLNRVYAVLSGINTLIVRVHERDELFAEACRIAVEQGKFASALIGLADWTAMKILPLASAGVLPDFVGENMGSFSLVEDAPNGNTMAARALRQRRAFINNDVHVDSEVLGAKELITHGISSVAALPILVSDQAVGVLVLYAAELGFFDEEEIRLLTELTGDIGFALDHIGKAEKLNYLAFYDQITGLPNRALLADRCTHDLKAARRDAEPLVMMVLGIDDFKAVNDVLGYAVGDQILQQLAGRVAAALRARDTVARVGGDEFVLVLPGDGPEGASQLADKLQHIVATPYPLNGNDVTISVSIGVALCPGDGSDFETLLQSAQSAMHQSKAHGRGNHRFFNARIFEHTVAQMALLAALRTAITRNQLDLHYQPFVDLQTGQMAGMEALLRWSHPELGAVSPARFIPVAEQAGLIVEIGAWVLRRACRDIRDWLDRGILPPPVSVNVSPVQLRSAGLRQQFETTMGEFAIDPAMVCVEVTEGALMEDVAGSQTLLRSLKTLGIKLSLDDFGTGYSSLSYLKQFPFDKVKLDQSFVRGLNDNLQDAVIAKVVISMAHGLGLRVIAEGVETDAQCEFLRANMSDEIQGYFFSRPVPKDRMEGLLRSDQRLPAHLLRQREQARTLLLVDDEPNVISTLKRLLHRDGYQILSAGSGEEGLAQLSGNPVDIIVSDQRMPGMTGVEFLTRAKALYPETVRIVLSGYTELKSVTDAINEGAAYRFLTKPWNDDELRRFVKEAFEFKELADKNRKLGLQIQTANQELAFSNRQLQEVLDRQQRQVEMVEPSLTLVGQAFHAIPMPVLGLDSAGLIVFANTQAQGLFASAGAILERAVAAALPALDVLLATLPAAQFGQMLVDGLPYRVQWQPMGEV